MLARLATLASMLALAACSAAPHTATPDRREPASPTMPGPSTGAVPDGRVEANAGCARCHAEIAAQWRDSQHAGAFVDDEFQRALAREPQGFCRGCHAPEADPRDATPAAAAAALGVACVSCHVPKGGAAVLATGPSTDAPHPVHASAAFATVDACAGCHEFSFPRWPDLPMQSTVSEHAASAFADRSCADCHMPYVELGGRRVRSHAFAASRDPQVLRRAVEIDVTREGELVRVRLRPGEIGHAFPTGDLFRRLAIEVEAIDADGDIVGHDARALMRHFVEERHGALSRRLREGEDDRVGAPALAATGGAVEVELAPADGLAALTVRWRLVHQRIEVPEVDGEVAVAGQVVFAQGELSPEVEP